MDSNEPKENFKYCSLILNYFFMKIKKPTEQNQPTDVNLVNQISLQTEQK